MYVLPTPYPLLRARTLQAIALDINPEVDVSVSGWAATGMATGGGWVDPRDPRRSQTRRRSLRGCYLLG